LVGECNSLRTGLRPSSGFRQQPQSLDKVFLVESLFFSQGNLCLCPPERLPIGYLDTGLI
jgi:hypothetical protein